MKIILSTIFLLFQLGASGFQDIVPQEEHDFKYYYALFEEYLNRGDFLKCERSMLEASQLELSEYRKAVVYNNLGVIYFNLGSYDDALNAYSRIETLNLTPSEIRVVAPSTLINRAVIYGKRKIYDKAISYYERAIRILEKTAKDEKLILRELSLAYYNLGTVYSERGEFLTAMRYFNQSLSLMEKHKINEKELPLSTLAKCNARLNNSSLAEVYFKRCITTSIRENGSDYYRLYEVYRLYADFLRDVQRFDEAASIYRAVLSYSLRKYGSKNTHTSGAYKSLGELKFQIFEYDSSLYYYQRSLVSVVSNFNSENIQNNPAIDSCYSNLILLDNLKGKSKVLEKLADTLTSPEERIKTLELGLSTIELAMNLTDVIRRNFPTEESKIYLSEIEKETYISGIRIASELYGQSKNDSLLERMYGFAQRSKAAVLRNQLMDNKALYASAIPDSIIERQRRLASNIAGYKMIIADEENSLSPDRNKINLWKDELFEMNLQKEALDNEIAKALPTYSDLSLKTMTIPLKEIMRNLERNEIIIDYSLSNTYREGERDLYMFLIDNKGIKFHKSGVDSLFSADARVLRNTSDPVIRENTRDLHKYLSALFNMYNILIKPVENDIKKRIIIIPDEEISWLPFEAFLTEMPSRDQVDFEGLHFLLYDHPLSHAYSSSLIRVHPKVRKGEVVAFSPVYDRASGYNQLNGAKKEIESIIKIMGGKIFTSPEAARKNFLKSMQDSVIFHLAMHTSYDSTNSLNSYLLFDMDGNDPESAKLYNYEISLGRMTTPMIVLSSCNSGAGTLKRSEGLLSIARSFILAGASSVVRAAWEINDDSGSDIISRFYHYLSRGYSKDRALQLAKIDFLEKSSPSFRDPYFWAAYEIVGDNYAVKSNKIRIVTFVTITILLISSGVFIYLRRRRIFAARSL